jgi:hypothetical protein
MGGWKQRKAAIAARVYAAVMSLCGFALVFLGWVIAQTHAAGGAPFLFVPGVVFIALSVFVWRESAWSMIVALVISLVLAVMIGSGDPQHWWVLVPVPVVFAMLTFLFLYLRQPRMERS